MTQTSPIHVPKFQIADYKPPLFARHRELLHIHGKALQRMLLAGMIFEDSEVGMELLTSQAPGGGAVPLVDTAFLPWGQDLSSGMIQMSVDFAERNADEKARLGQTKIGFHHSHGHHSAYQSGVDERTNEHNLAASKWIITSPVTLHEYLKRERGQAHIAEDLGRLLLHGEIRSLVAITTNKRGDFYAELHIRQTAPVLEPFNADKALPVSLRPYLYEGESPPELKRTLEELLAAIGERRDTFTFSGAVPRYVRELPEAAAFLERLEIQEVMTQQQPLDPRIAVILSDRSALEVELRESQATLDEQSRRLRAYEEGKRPVAGEHDALELYPALLETQAQMPRQEAGALREVAVQATGLPAVAAPPENGAANAEAALLEMQARHSALNREYEAYRSHSETAANAQQEKIYGLEEELASAGGNNERQASQLADITLQAEALARARDRLADEKATLERLLADKEGQLTLARNTLSERDGRLAVYARDEAQYKIRITELGDALEGERRARQPVESPAPATMLDPTISGAAVDGDAPASTPEPVGRSASRHARGRRLAVALAGGALVLAAGAFVYRSRQPGHELKEQSSTLGQLPPPGASPLAAPPPAVAAPPAAAEYAAQTRAQEGPLSLRWNQLRSPEWYGISGFGAKNIQPLDGIVDGKSVNLQFNTPLGEKGLMFRIVFQETREVAVVPANVPVAVRVSDGLLAGKKAISVQYELVRKRAPGAYDVLASGRRQMRLYEASPHAKRMDDAMGNPGERTSLESRLLETGQGRSASVAGSIPGSARELSGHAMNLYERYAAVRGATPTVPDGPLQQSYARFLEQTAQQYRHTSPYLIARRSNEAVLATTRDVYAALGEARRAGIRLSGRYHGKIAQAAGDDRLIHQRLAEGAAASDIKAEFEARTGMSVSTSTIYRMRASQGAQAIRSAGAA